MDKIVCRLDRLCVLTGMKQNKNVKFLRIVENVSYLQSQEDTNRQNKGSGNNCSL